MVTDLMKYPYCCIAKIYSGGSWLGTGFAVSNRLLATARHCVTDRRGWKSSLTAYFCDLRVFGGQSGSPVYELGADGPYALAIITQSRFPVDGTDRSIARRIDGSLVG